MKTSLFKKYFLLTSCFLLIGFTILGMLLAGFLANFWKNEKQEQLYNNITSIASLFARSVGTYNGQGVLYLSETTIVSLQIASLSNDADIFMVYPDGTYLYCSDSNTPSCPHRTYTIPKDIVEKAINGGFNQASTFGSMYDKPQYAVGVPIRTQGGVLVGAAFAATPTDSLTSYTADILKMFLLAAAIVIVFTFVGVYMITYRLVRPLHAMADAAKSMSRGDFSNRIPVTSDDEIGALAIAFNNMSQSLSASEQMHRSFIANVSHELKTPMTTIAGFIDGILDGTIPYDKQKHYLRIVSDEVRRLSRMVATMLNLAKFEAGELKVNPSKFSLTDLVCRTLIPLEQLITNKQLEIRGLEDCDSVELTADRDMLSQAVYNLIDNAIKFTNPGGYIEFGIAEKDGRVFFSIRNSGTGIPMNDLPHIFERFYKSDKSRSMDRKGTGLGLYIVKTVISMHHGQIVAKSAEGEYTEFDFWLPEQMDDRAGS